MAHALNDNGKGNIYCVDPNIEHLTIKKPLQHARNMLKKLNLESIVRIHTGFFSDPRETTVSNSPILGRKISDIVPPVDLALIDGDHATTAVLQDFMLLFPCLKPRSTVIFHDVKTWPTVRQGILTLFQDEIFKNHMQYFNFVPSGIDGLAVIEINKG